MPLRPAKVLQEESKLWVEEEILSGLIEVAHKGRKSAIRVPTISKVLVIRLQELGYKVTVVDASGPDLYDAEISWQ